MSEETRTVSATGGEKGVKPERYDLIPREATDALARVYAFGATKYADHNWRRGYEWSKSYAAAMRHLTAFWSGETYDSESGLPHIGHAMFHLAALSTWLEQDGEGGQFDDRYRPAEDTRAEEWRILCEQVGLFDDVNKTPDPDPDPEAVADGILEQRLFRPGPTQVDGRIDRGGQEELTLTPKGWEERLGVKLLLEVEPKLMTQDEFWVLARDTGADHTARLTASYDASLRQMGPDLLPKRAPNIIIYQPTFHPDRSPSASQVADAIDRYRQSRKSAGA